MATSYNRTVAAEGGYLIDFKVGQSFCEPQPEELDTLLAEGLASKQLTEDEFWSSVSKQTDALLAEHKTGPRS
jgi:hypothetical protein